AQQQLSTSMQSYWTSFAKYGRPLAPRAAFWPSYSIAQHDRLRLVSPGPYTFGTIVSDHQCSFWMPYIFQYETFLPEDTPY
ncbi:hypothetical protein ACSTHI_23585, partial [Vibrio parahaemolyticus]